MSGQAFLLFFLLSLACYGIQRVITTDDWPPSEWFRQSVTTRFGRDSGWAIFFECSFCIGFWLSAAVFAWAWYLIDIPYPVIQLFASRAVVLYFVDKES